MTEETAGLNPVAERDHQGVVQEDPGAWPGRGKSIEVAKASPWSAPPSGGAASALLTTEEAASFLRLAKNTLEIWRVRGRGPVFLKLGSRVVYERSALEEYAAGNRRKSTSDGSQKRVAR